MSSELVKFTAQIVDAYVSNNELPSSEVPEMLERIHATLTRLARGEAPARSAQPEEAAPAPRIAEPVRVREETVSIKPVPAVPISQAISENEVFCLLCGKGCKALKSHLTRTHQIEIKDYFQLFDLPKDFPLVAPSYASRRRQLALESGLGDKLRRARRKRTTTTKPAAAA